jgi:hypothetical protein
MPGGMRPRHGRYSPTATTGAHGICLRPRSASPRGAARLLSRRVRKRAGPGRGLGEPRDTYAAIDRVHILAGSLAPPDLPEHHYRYDPTKAIAYTATTLAWVGDPAAEGFAREIITRLRGSGGERWPRRVATANLDLALTLLATDQLDEAADAARSAMLSGMVVPSNHWRAREVVTAVESRGLSVVADLREVYELMRQG